MPKDPVPSVTPRDSGRLRNILTVSGASAASQGILALSTPFLTRLYLPQEYASWALFVGLVTILGSVVTLRYELAVVLPKKESEALNLFGLGLFLVAAGTLGAWGLALGAKPLLKLAGIPLDSTVLVLLPFFILFSGFNQLVQGWFTRTKAFKTLALSGFLFSAGTTLAQLLSAYWLRRDFLGLIFGSFVGFFLCSLIGLIAFLRTESGFTKALSLPEMKRLAIEHRNFPLYITPYTLAGVVRERAVLILLNSYATTAIVGYFALAYRLVNLPVSLVSAGIRPVLFQMAVTHERSEVESFLRRVFSLLVVLVIPYWVLFLFEAESFFILVCGPAWQGAGTYGILLSFPAVFFLFANWTDRLFDVHRKQRTAMTLEMVFSLLSVAALLVTLMVTKKPVPAVLAQSIVLVVYNAYWLRQVFNTCGFDPSILVSLFRQAAATMLTCVCAYLLMLKVAGGHAPWIYLAGASVAVLVYGLRAKNEYTVARGLSTQV